MLVLTTYKWLQEKTIMTELSVMLISGRLADGATVNITTDCKQQRLEYGVTGMSSANSNKRAKGSTTESRKSNVYDLDGEVEFMED